MNIEDLKKEFDQALAQMSDQDIVAAFAAIDCDVEIASEGDHLKPKPENTTQNEKSN